MAWFERSSKYGGVVTGDPRFDSACVGRDPFVGVNRVGNPHQCFVAAASMSVKYAIGLWT